MEVWLEEIICEGGSYHYRLVLAICKLNIVIEETFDGELEATCVTDKYWVPGDKFNVSYIGEL